MERAEINLDNNEVILRERAARDGQHRMRFFIAVVADADEGRALTFSVAAVVPDVAAVEGEECIFTLNVDDIVGGNAGVLCGILTHDRAGLRLAGVHDRHACSVDLQGRRTLHSAAVEGMTVQVKRHRLVDGDVLPGIRQHRHGYISTGRVDSRLQRLIALVADLGDSHHQLAVGVPQIAVRRSQRHVSALGHGGGIAALDAAVDLQLAIDGAAFQIQLYSILVVGAAGNLDVTVDGARALHRHGNAGVAAVAAGVERKRAVAITLRLTRVDGAVLDHHVAAVVGHGVDSLITAGDRHVLQGQVAVVLDQDGGCAVPIRGILGRLGALADAHDSAVLEGDLAALQQLERIGTSTGRANQYAAHGVGEVTEVNDQALVGKVCRLDLNAVAVGTHQQLDGIAVLGIRDGFGQRLVLVAANNFSNVRNLHDGVSCFVEAIALVLDSGIRVDRHIGKGRDLAVQPLDRIGNGRVADCVVFTNQSEVPDLTAGNGGSIQITRNLTAGDIYGEVILAFRRGNVKDRTAGHVHDTAAHAINAIGDITLQIGRILNVYRAAIHHSAIITLDSAALYRQRRVFIHNDAVESAIEHTVSTAGGILNSQLRALQVEQRPTIVDDLAAVEVEGESLAAVNRQHLIQGDVSQHLDGLVVLNRVDGSFQRLVLDSTDLRDLGRSRRQRGVLGLADPGNSSRRSRLRGDFVLAFVGLVVTAVVNSSGVVPNVIAAIPNVSVFAVLFRTSRPNVFVDGSLGAIAADIICERRRRQQRNQHHDRQHNAEQSAPDSMFHDRLSFQFFVYLPLDWCGASSHHTLQCLPYCRLAPAPITAVFPLPFASFSFCRSKSWHTLIACAMPSMPTGKSHQLSCIIYE